MRIQLLVSKFGRSSKPSPRFLAVVRLDNFRSSLPALTLFAITQTEKAVYFVVNTEKTGMTLERKVPLVTIKSLAMSSLRDDWIVLNLGPTEEGDPVFSCVFKTELASTIITLTNASINLLIGPKFVPLFIAYRASPDIVH